MRSVKKTSSPSREDERDCEGYGSTLQGRVSLKRWKYAYKRQAIGIAPHLYWAGRRMLFGPLEPELALLPLLCRPNAATLDIGANWGAYSEAALGLSSTVHCFEPQSELAAVLRRGLGCSERVTVYEVALSNRDGVATFQIPRNDIGYSTLEPNNELQSKVDMRHGIETREVQTRRLDSFDFGPVGFIKIDVEGHEQEVLDGASSLLTRHRPALLVEIEERHRKGAVAAVVGYVTALGYDTYVFTGAGLRKIDAALQAPTAGIPRNFVFVHPEHLPPRWPRESFGEFTDRPRCAQSQLASAAPAKVLVQ